ncbi:MAG: hypothetical protein GXO98_05940 [Nitrospirae bacterium]|nr:hypothetical protein [Nitrospirota bacterium]
MGKLKKVKKVPGLIAAAILLIGAVVYTALNYSTGKALERELKALKDSGIPLTPIEVAPPPVPDEENAALLYRKAFTLMVREKSEEEKKAYKALVSFSQKPINWSEENVSTIRSFLRKNESALNLVRQATRRDKCRFPLEYKKGYDLPLPHLKKMRELARLLALEAGLQSREGQTDESLKTIQVGLRMGKSLFTEPILISQLVRMSIYSTMLKEMEMLLDRNNETRPAIYKALIKELDDLEGHPAFTRSLEGERAMGLWAFAMIRKEPSLVRESFGDEGLSYRLYGSYLLRPILKIDEVYYLRMMERLIALSRLPYYQAIVKVRNFDKELKSVPRYCFLTGRILPSLGKAFVVQARSEARIRAGKLALALKIYKAGKGIYPPDLKALTPEILPRLPKDPFTGKDYIYKREGEGFIVYSVGDNLKDDKGAFNPKRWEEGDIPWRCTPG